MSSLRGGTSRHRYIFIIVPRQVQSSTDLKSSSWTFIPRKEAREAKEAPQEVRPVLPRGSVARLKTQHDLLPWDCRQPLPLKLDPLGRKHQYLRRMWVHLQQWRSIQKAYRAELQRMQHRINHYCPDRQT